MNLLQAFDAGEAQTAKDLSARTDIDATFLDRILRHLSTGGVLDKVDEESYTAKARTKEISKPGASGAITFILEATFPYYARIPDSLRQRNWVPSTGPGNSLWKEASGTNQAYYEWLKNDPRRMTQFDGMVKGFADSRQPWVDVFPTEQLFVNEEQNCPVLVDVGGGRGHDIEEFLQKHPEAAGRLVLQDLPDTVNAARVSNSVQKMPHNFFMPQPIYNAHAYFLHSVLHNWPDDKCKEILLNLKSAMRKGYSRILVEDVVIQNNNPSQLSCAIDMRMLWNFGSGERSEKDWCELFASVGMRVCKVWFPSRDGPSIIEVEVAE